MKVTAVTGKAHKVAKESRKNSYSPYSKFKVGAGLVTSSGKIYGGCNVENASYGGAVCAERVAITKAVSEGQKRFREIVVVTDSDQPAYPCAFCLQTMAEFFDPDTMIYIANTKKVVSGHRFIDLLPKPFGPKQLKEAR